jgi:hypothetical protein
LFLWEAFVDEKNGKIPNSPWVSIHGHSWLGLFGCTHNHHVNIEFLYGGFRCCLSPNWCRLDRLSPGDRETVWDGRLTCCPPRDFLFSHGFSMFLNDLGMSENGVYPQL